MMDTIYDVQVELTDQELEAIAKEISKTAS